MLPCYTYYEYMHGKKNSHDLSAFIIFLVVIAIIFIVVVIIIITIFNIKVSIITLLSVCYDHCSTILVAHWCARQAMCGAWWVSQTMVLVLMLCVGRPMKPVFMPEFPLSQTGSAQPPATVSCGVRVFIARPTRWASAILSAPQSWGGTH